MLYRSYRRCLTFQKHCEFMWMIWISCRCICMMTREQNWQKKAKCEMLKYIVRNIAWNLIFGRELFTQKHQIKWVISMHVMIANGWHRWNYVCTFSRKTLWYSNAIFALSLFSLQQMLLCGAMVEYILECFSALPNTFHFDATCCILLIFCQKCRRAI